MRVGLHLHRDVESGGYSGSFGSDETTIASKEEEELKKGMISRGGYMDLVSNVWHWHAVEWGGRCKLHFAFGLGVMYVFGLWAFPLSVPAF